VELADFLLDPLRSGIGRRALLEVALLGAVCGPLAFWIVSERLSYAAESLAHGLLPGLVLASLAGLPLLLGASGGVFVGAALIAGASRDERVGPETATGVVVTGMLGLGALLALAPSAPTRLEELLFGDPLGVSDGDLVAAGILATVGGAALVALHRPLSAVALDPDGASALGLRAALVRLALLALVAAAVAVAVQGLGNLLVLAVLIAPAVAVRRHARTVRGAMLAAGGLAVAAGVAGIYASFQLGSAAGASVALALAAGALCGAWLPAKRGQHRGAARDHPGAH
jgi:ABC-type Mn2+/Zn2+ transport system permease subunit